jgi:3-phenylpropionate/trans-cinnamate dioxygenase ferredoxin reductase component
MAEFEYLILGGGMTAAAAVRGIREPDPGGSIGVIGADPHPPYARPPLSKGLWKDAQRASVWLGVEDSGAHLHLGRSAQVLDTRNRRVTDDQGTIYSYGKLLYATGGTPQRLPFGGDAIIYFRTLDDYDRLRALAEQGRRFVVIGGGFIGSEIAAALAMNQKAVSLIFPGAGIGSHLFPSGLAQFLNGYYREKGVEVLTGDHVTSVEKRGEGTTVTTQGGRELVVDGVVAGLGIRPNVELAKAAGLEVGDGLVVDESLHTSDPHVFAAGDVAEFFNPALGKRLRVEHEDNANTMGHMAGRSMAGESVRYDHLPSFYSDLFDLGYEAVGELDSRFETIADWKEPYREGVVYYLHEGRVRGSLLWNVFGKVDAARELIARPGPFRREDLAGRL